MSTLDLIELEGLEFSSVIGVYPSERTADQGLTLDVGLWLDTRASSGGRIDKTVDYGRLQGELKFLMHAGKFALLETAAEALCRYLLAPPTPDQQRAQVNRCRVRLKKPSVKAALTVVRDAAEYMYAQEDKPFGKVDIVFEHDAIGIYRLRVAPKRSIPTHVHLQMDEHEMVIGKWLRLQNTPVAAGTVIDWPKQMPHRYDNNADSEQTILCVNRPRFYAADEIVVDDPPGGLVLPHTFNLYPNEHEAPYNARA